MKMIRRPLAISSVLVALALALALAGTTVAASPYRVLVLRQACTDSGGAHGRGYVLLRVKVREVGASGTNYFKIKSYRQTSSGTNYYRVVERRYDYKASDVVSSRIVIKAQFWSNSAGLLATRTVKGTGC
jgi:hypothetical protein